MSNYLITEIKPLEEKRAETKVPKVPKIFLKTTRGFMAELLEKGYARKSERKTNDGLYLWWENNSLKGKLVDYEMCVHVFGGTSSTGCCNYALRKTAVDNASNFKVGIAETFMKKILC